MLAVDHIGEQQYLELVKQVFDEDLIEFLELFDNKKKSKGSLSPSESSEGKKFKRSSSPFNTYIHLATTQHVRLRNLEGFWSQKRNAVPLVPRSPNMNRDTGSLKPAKVEIKATVVPKRKISYAESINRMLTAMDGEEERPFKLNKTILDESSKFLDLT
jgi:hypothetical protein